jgi:superfamily II DNA or RNA helicase
MPQAGAVQVLALHPPHYICMETRTIGALTLPIPNAQAMAMLRSPEIAPEDVEDVRKKLRGVIKDAPDSFLPTPIEMERQLGTPSPHLKLGVATLQPIKTNNWGVIKAQGAAAEIACAELSFSYEGKRIYPHDATQEIRRMKEGKAQIFMRNKEAEQQYEQIIKQSGINITFKDMKHLYHFHDKHIGKNTIGSIDKYFHKDKGLPAQWNNFMRINVPQLQQQGWKVTIAKDFPYNIVEADEEWYAEIAPMQPEKGSGIDWFGLELGITLDGQKLNLVPLLLALLKDEKDIFAKIASLPENEPLLIPLPDGRRLALPAERVHNVLTTLHNIFNAHHTNKEGQLAFNAREAALLAEMQAAMASLSLRWFGGRKLRDLGEKLRNFTHIAHAALPPSFTGELRHYQQMGLNWLQFLREHELAGILADDMGLGKTVQVLAHIATEKEAGRLEKPALVIAPTSLMGNWRNEAVRFAPSLSVLVLHGAERKAQFEAIGQHDLVLTTYPLLPRDKEELLQHNYHIIILDEAQTIKNARAQITHIVSQLKAQHRLCMTGTPLENHLGELWSLFNFLLPGYLGDAKQFTSIFRNPIEKERDRDRAQALSRKVKPFILRRTKQEVATELPPKTEIIRTIELMGAQRDLYEIIRTSMHEKIRAEIAAKGLAKSQIIVLDALLKLRQVCCDPTLLTSIEAAKKVKESAKRTALMEMIIPMVEEGRKILLFSQFTSMLKIITQELDTHNIPFVTITGKTKDRETPVRRFQEGEIPLFLISLKAGGTGLNLTAADTVIHYDPWWNPAAEAQATDRAYRIGQDKPVFVYKLITTGTVEEKILHMQEHKRALMDSLFDPAGKSSHALTADDIGALFEPLVS